MRPSISSSYLPDWEPHAMVACLAEHGWHAAELHDLHARQLLREGDPFAAGVRFRAYAADLGLSFPQGHFRSTLDEPFVGDPWFDIAPADDDEWARALEEMRCWVALFAGLEIKAAALHIGGASLVGEGWSPERAFARRVEAVRAIADYAQGGPTTICIENLAFAGSGVEDLASIQALLAAIDRDNVAICLDTGHAHLAGASIPRFIAEAGSALHALHVNDNKGRSDDHLLPFGGGHIDWPPVLGALQDAGYAGPLNLEITGENKCPEPIRLVKLDYALSLAGWMAEQASD